MTLEFANKRRGFSLTELAIVLGIVGVVLSALWSVVNLVRENVKREETLEQMTAIVSKIRDHYLGRACASTTFVCPSPVVDLTDDLFRKGVLLREQLRDPAAGTLVADHPWGPNGAGGTLIVSAVGRNAFSIALNSLSQNNCATLAPKLSGTGAPKGLTSLSINGNVFLAFPVPSETAFGPCGNAGATNTIVLTYALRP